VGSEPIKIVRVAGNDNGSRKRGGGDYDCVNRHFGPNVFHASQDDTRRFSRFERTHYLTRRKDLFPDIASPAPPFRHDGNGNKDSRAACAHKAQKPQRALLAAFRGD
jgi:hypothetical protein